MFRAAFVFVVALALTTGVPARPAHAGAWSLTPSLGPYVPATRLLFDLSSPTAVQLGPATAIGVNVGRRWSPRLVTEAAVGWGRNDLDILGSTGTTVDAAFVNTDALARWTLNPSGGPVHWDIVLGAGAYRLRGSFADFVRASSGTGFRARTRLSVIGGLGASWAIGNGIDLRLDGLDHMHGGGIESEGASSGVQFSRSVQHDVSMTVGLTLPLGK